MTNKTNAVIFDIDGTICDCTHRLHHIQKDKPDWDGFHADCGKDEPIYPILQLVQMYYRNGYHIIFCTGRMESNIEKTKAWLDFYSVPYNQIFMRKNDDYRSDYIIKKEMLDIILDDHIIHTIFEDRARVVQMYRDVGLICLQVKEGDY